MARNKYAEMFMYRMGQEVRWAEYPATCYYVCQRRWTQRDILAPIVQYLLQPLHKDATATDSIDEWAYEADLTVWKE